MLWLSSFSGWDVMTARISRRKNYCDIIGLLVMDREAWRAAIHGVTKSQTWLCHWTELNWIPSCINVRKPQELLQRLTETAYEMPNSHLFYQVVVDKIFNKCLFLFLRVNYFLTWSPVHCREVSWLFSALYSEHSLCPSIEIGMVLYSFLRVGRKTWSV